MNKRGEHYGIYLIIAAILIFIFIATTQQDKPTPTIPAAQITPNIVQTGGNQQTLGTRNKTADCTMNNWPYPDFDCTPGAIFTNVTVDQICTPGYSASVRDVPESLKDKVYTEYNIIRIPYAFEVDHCISLEIAGSNDISNLWIESYNDSMGARTKDRVENCLHRMVCNKTISLPQAQYDVCHNWTKYLKENGGTC